MIASPCRNCPYRNLPKDKCAKKCKLLQAVLEAHMKETGNHVCQAIDYADSTRFVVNESQGRMTW